MAVVRTRQELATKYTSSEWRETYLDLLSIVDALSNCVIEADFKVSDELNRAIILTDHGRKIREQLVTKESVDTKDATLLCLLTLHYVEPLVDIDAISIPNLIEALSKSVIQKRIRFPLIFGRELYDAATSLFPEERRSLKHEDTLKLLEDRSQGVFQTGHFLIGPFGIHRLSFERDVLPTLSVPIQHCSDPGCASVHRVHLSSSQEAGVNRNRPAIARVLAQSAKEGSDWTGFAADLTEDRYNFFAVDDSSTLPFLLGDALDLVELRVLAERLLKHAEGRVHAWAKTFGAKGNVEAWVSQLPAAELLNLLLTEPNDVLIEVLDAAVRDGDIHVPEGEIRRPVVNHRVRSGTWELRSELSSLGYRSVPSHSTVSLLRLNSFARQLFNVDEAGDMEDLSWLLRDVQGSTAEERLEAFLRTADPKDVVNRLVLARQANARLTSQQLGIPLRDSDTEFANEVLWKLGFAPDRRLDIRDRYWKLHDELEDFVSTASATTGATDDKLREKSTNYFVYLEQFLFDSLIFATWSLLTDHFSSQRPFEFREGVARKTTIEILNESVERKAGVEQNDLVNEPQLQQIVQGFIRLSAHLTQLRDAPDRFIRPGSQVPRFVKQTSLQRFPFVHTVPYLDLTAKAQVDLHDALARVGQQLSDSGIMAARNGLLHAKQRTPSTAEVTTALKRAREALRLLEEIGCVRTTYRAVSRDADEWGRTITLMRSHGKDIQFVGPAGFEMTRMPSLHHPLYLMQGAILAPPNEMLRFREGHDSRFATYWENFQHRPERRSRALSTEEAPATVGSLR